MSALSRQVCGWIGRFFLAAGLVVLASSASFGDAQWFPLRNNNPFLQVYGLPPFQDATLAASGELEYGISLDIANHADVGLTDTESVILDGESYFLVLSMRYGATRWLELGFDLPLVSHTDGIFDNAIESWHDLWGMSNTKRSGPANQLGFIYENPRVSNYELSAPSSGIGDLQVTAAVPIKRSGNQGDSVFSMRSSLKIPTGEAGALRGSGAFDFSLGLFANGFVTFAKHELQYSGSAGILLPGAGDLFPTLQRSAVAFGSFGASWQLTDRFSAVAQTYVQGSYLESDLDEIGGSSVQLALGGTYRFRGERVGLAFALVEDVFSNTTADVAIHFSVRLYGGSQESVR